MNLAIHYSSRLVQKSHKIISAIGIILMLNYPVFAQSLNTDFIPYITKNTSRIHDATFYEDGRILIAGDITLVNGNKVNGIARLLKDGQLDDSFNAGEGFNGSVSKIFIAGTKIIIIGNFKAYNGTPANGIIRLNSDGSIDESFKSGTGLTGSINDAIYLPDGKILVAGAITEYNNNTVKYIIKLTRMGL